MDYSPGKILIKEPNWLGDNVFTLPAVQALKRLYPRAGLTVLVRAGIAPLWKMVEAVDEVIGYELRGGGKDLRGKAKLLGDLRRRRFDLAVIFPRSFESALWTWLARIPRRWGYAEEGRGWLLTRRARSARAYRSTHRVDYYHQIVEELPGEVPVPRLNVSERFRKDARRLLADVSGGREWPLLVGLHPKSSYGPAKCWPLENYARLARRLVREKGAQVLVFGGEGEREDAQKLASSAGKGVISLAGETDLILLAALSSLCRLVVANDSGPLHLAAAVGTPVIGLFGSTDPRATAPRGREARVIYKNVSCGPCLLRVCPTDLKCLTRITPDEVMVVAEELWQAKTDLT